MSTEVAVKADFSAIRYAQCWEDADILLDALHIAPGDHCLSIASAGDNALAMLAHAPERVIALDLSSAQLACLALRVAAYRELSHAELLALIGSRPSKRRSELYQRCRKILTAEARQFWDAHPRAIEQGIGGAGKFEAYFRTFRRRVLPWVHSRRRIAQLLQGGEPAARQAFYTQTWDSWRWRALFSIFFSRFVMGRMGRDPSFFRYVEGSVAERILARARYALTELNPADNPYLQWILTGEHTTALPFALREENFDRIRTHLDRIEWHQLSIEAYLERHPGATFQRFNLSDIFEYMSQDNYLALLEQLIDSATPGARLAYWNMLVPRACPPTLAGKLRSLTDLAAELYARDNAFFYSAFIVEEVR